MSRWLRASRVVAILASPPSCGGGATTPTPTQATITVTLSPNPVTSTVCAPTPCQGTDGRLFQFRSQGTLMIQEGAGIGGTVDSITVTIVSSTIVYASDVIVQRSGTTLVPARGLLIFPLNIFHVPLDTPNASRQVVMPFVVQMTDDRGNHVTAVAQWRVN